MAFITLFYCNIPYSINTVSKIIVFIKNLFYQEQHPLHQVVQVQQHAIILQHFVC